MVRDAGGNLEMSSHGEDRCARRDRQGDGIRGPSARAAHHERPVRRASHEGVVDATQDVTVVKEKDVSQGLKTMERIQVFLGDGLVTRLT